jgi:hydrogenase maturation protease
MQRLEKISSMQCSHTKLGKAEGLALITIGDSLRGGDGIAINLCDQLEESTALQDICRFDWSPQSGFLSECLSSHKGAIIIDSTQNGTAAGTVSIMDLGAMVERTSPMNIRSCHGFSLADELRLTKRSGRLPKRIIFFGIEVNELMRGNGGEKLSSKLTAMRPRFVNSLSLLMTKLLETVKKDI